MPSIYILLTRSATVPARLIHLVTGDEFTHSSVAFDAGLRTLCSFARRYRCSPFPAGLVRENLDGSYYRRHGSILCALMEVRVSPECYHRALRRATRMLQLARLYRYSIRGLERCRRGVAEERKGYYFCSQFVGELLEKSGALELPKPASLMRPVDFTRLSHVNCLYRGRLDELMGCIQGLVIPNTAVV